MQINTKDKQILVLNAGSSSLKLGLFDWESLEQLSEKSISWKPGESTNSITGHKDAFEHILKEITPGSIAAIGHRVVHGGTQYKESVLIDAGVKSTIAKLATLAPLHNPAALEGIEAAQKLLPEVPQVACFDTAFHSTLPPTSYLYGLPYAWYEEWGLRRFGFHGLSHSYCADRAAQLLEKPLNQLNLVSCHLGNGCSLAAVKGGNSIATTMGFTPLDGLIMGNRSGAVDPGLLLYLLEHNYLSRAELDTSLNYESGLKGISGLSSDMRELQEAKSQGHVRAGLAIQLFTMRVCEGIATMVANLGSLDALIFTAGIGENSVDVRTDVIKSLGWLGLKFDDAVNSKVGRDDLDIASTNSDARILVVHTREEFMVAKETHRLLANRKIY